MQRMLIILLLILLFGPVFTQDPIDFEHKSLLKRLKKLDCSRDLVLKEIKIPSFIYSGEDLNGKYFYVEDQACSSDAVYVFIGRVNTCRSGGCVVHYGNGNDIGFEYFDYFIIFDYEAKVQYVKVFRYEATHGHEITAKRWLKQFEDYSGKDDLKVGKNIDSISGATTSVFCISYDIQERTQRLNKTLAYYISLIVENIHLE